MLKSSIASGVQSCSNVQSCLNSKFILALCLYSSPLWEMSEGQRGLKIQGAIAFSVQIFYCSNVRLFKCSTLFFPDSYRDQSCSRFKFQTYSCISFLGFSLWGDVRRTEGFKSSNVQMFNCLWRSKLFKVQTPLVPSHLLFSNFFKLWVSDFSVFLKLPFLRCTKHFAVHITVFAGTVAKCFVDNFFLPQSM